MERKHFINLLYVFGIVPMIYEASQTFIPSLGRIGFGLLNLIILVLFAILFTPNTTAATNKKKKKSIAILLTLLAFGLVISGFIRFSDQASTRIYSKVLAPSNAPIAPEQTTRDILSGSTGDTLSLSTGIIDSQSGSEIITPDYVPSTTSSGTTSVDIFQKPDPEIATTQENTTTPILPNKGTLNYAQVIPYLVAQYKLTSNNSSIVFKNITSSNALYKAFSIAASKSMIGPDINPASKVSCNTYMVLKGMAAGWKVEYKAGNPFGAYRTAAFNKGEVNGCVAGAFVTKATL